MPQGMNLKVNRRSFLKSTAAGLAAASAAGQPVLAAGRRNRPAPSERVVVGIVGVGGLGFGHHLCSFLLPEKRIEVGGVCDVDENHRNRAANTVYRKAGRRVQACADFRRLLDRPDIDAVLIATPDHWHALIALAAMEAGKDVYCEKPLTLTIEEGQAMVAAARCYGTVFQTGSMQRSEPSFLRLIQLVRAGVIGKVQRIETGIGDPSQVGFQSETTPPDHLDWDFWLGPAPWTPYTPDRCHYTFRWYLDYSGGKMTDWGAHHNDIAQWVLETDDTGPTRIEPLEAAFDSAGPRTVATKFKVRYTYADGRELLCGADLRSGVTCYGEKGWIWATRGDIEASHPEILKTDLGEGAIPPDYKEEPYEKYINHHNNWLDCLKSRQRCVCDVGIGHRSASVCHLGNIALRLGRPLTWDPGNERFIGDPKADRFVGKPMRAPWHL